MYLTDLNMGLIHFKFFHNYQILINRILNDSHSGQCHKSGKSSKDVSISVFVLGHHFQDHALAAYSALNIYQPPNPSFNK
jgi:hypothetical protein